MMKKLIYITLLLFVAASCRNKELCDDTHDGIYRTKDINVLIHWETGTTKPAKGMMINLFALDGAPKYGMAQLDADGGTVKLAEEASYFSLCYDYYAENIYFRNEYDMTAVEAYCAPLTRTTFSRADPDAVTVAEPDFPFWVDRVENFPVDGSDLHFYPENVVEIYTFEIRNVVGAQYITDTRGGIGGMAGSYFLYDGTLSAAPITVLFEAAKDGAGSRITGSFRTFGNLLNQTNKLTIEILYPSKSGGIINASWDVTDQVRSALHIPGTPDIIIDNSDEGKIPPIIPDDDDGGSGFDADVNEWNDIYVPMPV